MTTAVELAERGHQLAAWVNFNGTLDENSGGLTAGENVLIRASYNVSSCQYNGTGDYTVNFATAMPDENYSVSISAADLAYGCMVHIQNANAVLAGSCRVQTRVNNSTTPGLANNAFISASFFR